VVANFGTSSATDVVVQVDITGGLNVSFTDTVTGTIPAAGSTPWTLDSTINTLGVGQITITAYTIFATDQYSGNDTLVSIINFNPVPAPPQGADMQRCGPGSILFTGVASDTIYWYDAPSGGNLIGIGDLNWNIDSTTTLWAQTGFNCPSATRASVVGLVIPLPPVNLGADTTTECGVAITLDAGAGYTIYTWSTTESTQTISVDTLGDFSVTVTDTSGCSNSDTIHVDCTVGVTAIATMNNVHVYPNPSSGIVNIEFGNDMSAVIVRWIDMQGQIVSEDKLNGGIRQRQYDLSSAPKGVYFLQVLSDEGISLHRVVIQ
jgi:hypothetical protein